MKKIHHREFQAFEKRRNEPQTEELQIQAAILQAEAGDPEHALNRLGKVKGNSPPLINARGVCLLRLGRYEDALRLFRGLVLPAGCTWMKMELPVIYRTNFCLSLFLAGHPAGCANCLVEVSERSHPSVIRMNELLEHWEKSLPWWPRLQWKLGVEPQVPLKVDFPPGEFLDATEVPPRPSSEEAGQSRAA